MGRERGADQRLGWKRVKEITWRQAWDGVRQRLRSLTLVNALLIAGIVLLVILGGYAFGWTGFGESVRRVGGDRDLQRAKTFWDWLDLAIVPLALAVGAYLLNQEGTRRTRISEEKRARETTLREYLDRMGQLMIEHDVYAASDNNERARKFMRALTLSVLRSFGIERNEGVLPLSAPKVAQGSGPRTSARPYLEDFFDLRIEVLRFLHQAGLIEKTSPVVVLAGADLIRADLSSAELNGAGLGGVVLRDAVLIDARLRGADLRGSNLTGAKLIGADLTGADLTGAEVTRENLTGATLTGAVGLPTT